MSDKPFRSMVPAIHDPKTGVTTRLPSILSGLTLGQVIEMAGYDYRVTTIEIAPARYRPNRKRLTARARRWTARHWATYQHHLTLTPMTGSDLGSVEAR